MILIISSIQIFYQSYDMIEWPEESKCLQFTITYEESALH